MTVSLGKNLRHALLWVGLAAACTERSPRVGHGEGNASLQPPPEPVESRAPVTPYVAVVFAKSSVEVTSKLEGRITMLDAEVGERVNAGQRLATLWAETTRRDLTVARAAATGAVARASRSALALAQARERFARRKALVEGVSAEELRDADLQEKLASADAEAAVSSVAEAQARVTNLEQELASAVVRAPFTGTVAARYLSAGAWVKPGTPILRLIAADDLWARFAVPEREVSQVRLDRRVRLEVASLGASVVGTVKTIAPELDSASQMLFVEAKLVIPEALRGKLQAGTTGGAVWIDPETNPAAP